MSRAADDPEVIVIGAGVMGLSLAWSLVKRGRRVLCIDRSVPGREASAATAGTLAVQNKPLASIPMTLRSLELWRGMAVELGRSVDYEVRGGLRVAHSDDDLEKLRRSAAAQLTAGAPIELLSRVELRSIAPYLSPDVCAATFCPLDGMADPFLVVRALFRACRAAGVVFQLNRAVSEIMVEPDATVRIKAGADVFAAGAAVIATGAWIPSLVGGLLPITTKVQQVLITDAGVAVALPHVVTHVRGNLTLKQQALTRKVLIGGGWTGTGNEQCGKRRLSRESMRGNASAAIATVPSLGSARLLRAWTGFEGRTPDRLPVIGPLSGRPNLHVLGCASGGFTLAPAAGELLARRLCGERDLLSLEPFSPARFEGQAAIRSP